MSGNQRTSGAVMVRHIEIIPEYFACPITDRDAGEEMYMEDVPISQSLKDRLQAWAERFDATIDVTHPYESPNPGFASPEDQADFVAQGYVLWHDLQQELGQEFVMFYFDVIQGRRISPPGYTDPEPTFRTH
jgi:hypothetical protein